MNGSSSCSFKDSRPCEEGDLKEEVIQEVRPMGREGIKPPKTLSTIKVGNNIFELGKSSTRCLRDYLPSQQSTHIQPGRSMYSDASRTFRARSRGLNIVCDPDRASNQPSEQVSVPAPVYSSSMLAVLPFPRAPLPLRHQNQYQCDGVSRYGDRL
jgi:hypothetical protein